MMRSLYSAASGMMAQQTNVDVIANNLANVNTIGYKSQSAEFKSLLYQDLQAKTTEELQAQLVDAKKELFNLRFQNATNQLDNTSRIKDVRRNIARIQTVITQKSKAEA